MTILSVRDTSGRPVEDAGLYASPVVYHSMVDATDPDGLTRIVDMGHRELDTAEVHALGYTPAPLVAHLPLGARADVTLQECCRLRVSVEWLTERGPIRSFSLQLRASNGLAPEPSGRELCMGATKSVRAADRASSRLFTFGEEELDILGLVADVPYELSLLGSYGATLESRTVTLVRGEWRDERFIVDDSAARLEGVVRWPDGQPVERAGVLLVSASDSSVLRRGTMTNGSGAYVFHDVFADSVTIEVELPNAKRAKRMLLLAVPVQPPVTRHDIVFQPASALVLDVREQGTGRRVVGATGTARCGPRWINGDQQRGALVFEGLPPGLVDLRVRAAGRNFVARREAEAGYAVLEVPGFGALVVRAHRAGWDEARSLRLILTSADGQRSQPLVRDFKVAPGEGPAFLRFATVFAGNYTLRTELEFDGAVEEARQDVEIIAGETTTVDVNG